MIEDVNGILSKDIDLRAELKIKLEKGLNRFSELADLKHGWTHSPHPTQSLLFNSIKESKEKTNPPPKI
jgi:hypothetical protein